MSSNRKAGSWFDISLISGRRYGGLRTHGVVIDIGQRYTKVGFAGEAQPRTVFPTNFKLGKKTVQITSGMQPLDEENWISILEPFFRNIYYQLLQVNPAERPVLILENRFWPYVFKDALAKVLFGKKYKFGAPSLLFLSMEAVPIYATGKENGLVIDVGYTETRISPIAHGFPLQGAYQTGTVGMKDVQKKFKADLTDANMDFMTLENMIIRTCVVQGRGDDSKLSDVHYPFMPVTRISSISEKKVLPIPASVRSNSTEALFGDNRPEAYNIAHLILDCLLKCDADQRALVISNMILCGGTTHLPGFGYRLVQEMHHGMEQPKYFILRGMRNKFQFFKSHYPNNVIQWVGGAVVGSLDLSGSLIEKTEWEDGTVRIPDWSRYSSASESDSSGSESEEGDISDEGDEGDEAYIQLGLGNSDDVY